MPATESFVATSKHHGGHGLAGYWWFVTNGINPSNVAAHQTVLVDVAHKVAYFQVFDTDQAGRRILTEDGFVKRQSSEPIAHLPSVYGLPSAVAA